MASKHVKNKQRIYDKLTDGVPENSDQIEASIGTNPKIKQKQKVQVSSEEFEKPNETDINLIANKTIPNIKEIEKNVLEYIIGQDTQVRQIITGIYRSMYFESIKSNLLVIGSSGTGKTATIEQIAKRLDIPYVIEDATKYTQEGYKGADVEDIIYNLIDEADQDIEKAQRGIIVIDEIDKKAGNKKDDISGTEVLKSLLKIIEGTIIKIPSLEYEENELGEVIPDEFFDFDTRNLIIIFLGAFSGLEKIRSERLNSNCMGFQNTENLEKKQSKETKVLKQDLIKYGMPEEFVGRVDTIIEMNKLTQEDLSLILRKSKLSIFRRYQNEFKKRGIRLSYHGELFDKIASASLTLDTGARELSNTVNNIFENIMYDIFSSTTKYKKCILDIDIVNDNTKYELV